MNRNNALKKLVLAALFVALDLLFTRVFCVYLMGGAERVSLQTLASAVCGWALGPWWGAGVAPAADLLGSAVGTSGLSFFPGFTLTAALAGMNYGLWLYRRKDSLWRVALCVLPITLVCNIALNTLWLWMLYGDGMLVTFPARALKNLAQYPVNVALLYLTMKFIRRLPTSLTQV